jgi:hypothetical protein
VSVHPSPRVGYRVLLAAWLRDQGLKHNSSAVDALVQSEAAYIEARNHQPIWQDATDAEVAELYDIRPSTVRGIRAELRRRGEALIDDL